MDPAIIDRQLEILYERGCYMAEAVANNSISLLDAADFLQSAAEWSGLVYTAGQDIVQRTITAALVGTRAAA